MRIGYDEIMNDKFIPKREWYVKELNDIEKDLSALQKEMGVVDWSKEYHRFFNIRNGIDIISNLLNSDERII